MNMNSVKDLRKNGYSVVIFSPEEIGKHDIGVLEDIMIERGNYYLMEDDEEEGGV